MGVYLAPPLEMLSVLIDSIKVDATFPKTTGLDMLFEERLQGVGLVRP